MTEFEKKKKRKYEEGGKKGDDRRPKTRPVRRDGKSPNLDTILNRRGVSTGEGECRRERRVCQFSSSLKEAFDEMQRRGEGGKNFQITTMTQRSLDLWA